MKKKLFYLKLMFLTLMSVQMNAQTFLNGSFETTTSNSCLINITDATFNTQMNNTTAFGNFNMSSIVTSGCSGTPTAAAGTKYVGLETDNVTFTEADKIALQLSSPLISGNLYSITFKANSPDSSGYLVIGISTQSNAVESEISYHGVNTGWQTFTVNFTANINATYITVMPFAGFSFGTVYVDDFSFQTPPSTVVLTQIGNEGDDPNTIPSVVTVAQLGQVLPAITGILVANQTAYQAYIDANPSLFSAPATAAEVQTMVTAVNAIVAAQPASNAVLTQIGNEGDDPDTVPSVVTVAQLGLISPAITGIVAAYEANYQFYIDLHPDLFSEPATRVEVQAMVTTVNTQINTPVTNNYSVCQGGTVTTGFFSSLGGGGYQTLNFTGNTTGAPTFNRPNVMSQGGTCSNSPYSTRYVTHTFTALATGSYVFSTCGNATWDTFLAIYASPFDPNGLCAGNTLVASNDDSCSSQSILYADLVGGTSYTLVVTGFSNSDLGPYTVISTTPLISDNVEWYTASTGGTAIGTGSPFNPVGVSGSGLTDTNTPGTTTFYAQYPGQTIRTSVDFTINASITTTFAPIAAICSGSTAPILPLTSNNGITGTWSPATVNNMATGTYTFTPADGQCATTANLSVTVNAATSSTTTATACDSYTWTANGTTYTTSGTYTNVTTNPAGCPDTATLVLTINNSTSSSMIVTACDSYTWAANGTTYTASGTYTNVTTNPAGCPDTATLVLTINNSTSSSMSVTACDSYTWAANGTTYTTSGTYTNVTTNPAGCPDTATLVLTINNSTSSSMTVSACDTYTWAANGTTYTASGTYTNVTTNPAGCPDTATLVLTINNSTSSSMSATACDTYTWAANGTTYTASGTYTNVTTNPEGCPDTATLVLTINNSTSSSMTVTACDSYTWTANGTTYTTSGTYTNVTTNPAGCPDTATLVLTINNSTSSSISVTACDTYTWAANGTTYTASGTYTNVTTNPAGCPDTATLVLTINNSTSSSMTVTACDTYTWAANGTTYTASGTYTNVTTNPAGCPDTATLVLTINNSTSSSMTVSACDTYTWAANGTTYTASGTYTNVTTNPAGCPDTATLVLTINTSTPTTESITACDSYTWAANGTTYTASGTYTFIGVNGAGCSLNATLVLTINNSTSSTTTETACDSYTWAANGTTYTASGTYTNVTTNAAGCPDTATLVLTINNSTSSSMSVTACDTYTWAANGTTYTASGTYTNVTTNPAGCPDTATLVLTINNSTSSSMTVSACDTYTWTANGTTYTASGTYTNVTTNPAGCPDTATLVLTINNSTSSSMTVSACDTYTWAANGTTYTASGTYTNVTTNPAGCPDTATLVLTINTSTPTTESITACDSYTWAANGTTYTASGTYTFVGVNGAGCSLNATLVLTINNSTSSTTTETACDSYTWAANGTTYTTSGTYTNVTTNPAGCSDTATLILTINPSATPTFAPIAAICSGDTAPMLDTTSTNGIIGTWSPATVDNMASGTYTFTPDAGQCATTTTLSVTVNSAETPTGDANQTISVVSANDATVANLVVTPTNVIWYATLADAQAGTNALANTTVLTNASTYYAVNVVGSCSSTPLAVTVSVTLGNEEFDSLSLAYWPNPTSSIVNISYSKTITQLSVTNILGQQIMSKNVNATEVQIDLSGLADATYFIKVISEGNEKVVKVIKKD